MAVPAGFGKHGWPCAKDYLFSELQIRPSGSCSSCQSLTAKGLSRAEVPVKENCSGLSDMFTVQTLLIFAEYSMESMYEPS